jgi:succinyl-diaminopimelate desuccinylase
MQQRREEIEMLAKQLIEQVSTRDNLEARERCLEILEAYFQDTPVMVKKFPLNGYPSTIFLLGDHKDLDLVMYGHIDVVDGHPEQFIPKVEGDRLIGRGASDMKGMVAMEAVLLKQLAKKHPRPNIAFLVVTDEEWGNAGGARNFLNEGYVPRVTLMPDGGDHFELVLIEKGVIWFELTANGEWAHGSRPWLGKNAIEIMMDALGRIKKSFELATADEPENVSMNIGHIKGGDAYNVVPNRVTCWVDIRHTPTHTSDQIIELVKNAVGPNVDVKVTIAVPSFSVDKNSEIIRLMQEIMKEHLGIDPVLQVSCGASDAIRFAEQNIPVVITKPHCGGHHADPEWLDLKSTMDLYQIYEKYIERFATLIRSRS